MERERHDFTWFRVNRTFDEHSGSTEIDGLQAIVDSNPGTPLADKVEDALAKLQTALNELTENPPDNQGAVGVMVGAVADLDAAVSDGLLDLTLGTQLMDQVVGIALALAQAAIDEAIAQGGDPDKINEAEASLASGDDLRDDGSFEAAVNAYKDAVAQAEGA